MIDPNAGVPGPAARLAALVAGGRLSPDPAQAVAAARLDALWRAVQADPTGSRPAGGGGLLSKLFGGGAAPNPGPLGLYLYGPVGRGKSLLLDLFLADLPAAARPRRVHFHAFLQEIHARLHRARHAGGRPRPVDDVLPGVARALAGETRLLGFDEMQVRDIADAMILGRLFEALFAEGVRVVTTSNQPPSDLYAGGLQRELFLPFIALLESRLEVVSVAGPQDFRRTVPAGEPVWHTPLGPPARAALDAAFRTLSGGISGAPRSLPLPGRTLRVPCAAGGVSRWPAAALLEAALGPADHLAITRTFHSVLIDDVTPIAPGERDRARRLITLIDALYEHQCQLIVSASVPPDALYPEGKHTDEYRRTASRLAEMQGAAWRDRPHRPTG